MEQIARKTFGKLNQDLSKNKYPEDTYYSATDVRIVNNGATGSVTNIKGTSAAFTFPTINSNPTSTKTYLSSLASFPATPIKTLGETEIDNILYSIVQYGNFVTENNFSYVSKLALTLNQFQVGETISVGANTATINSIDGNVLGLLPGAGTINNGDVILGGTSGAKGKITALNTNLTRITFDKTQNIIGPGVYLSNAATSPDAVGLIISYDSTNPLYEEAIVEMVTGTFEGILDLDQDDLFFNYTGTGTFTALTSTSLGAVGVFSVLAITTITLDTFSIGNVVTGGTSTNSGTIYNIIDNVIYVDVENVLLTNGETITEPSNATATINSVAIESQGELFNVKGYPIAIIKTVLSYDVNNAKQYTNSVLFFDILDINITPLDVKGIFENENVIKLYWADGTNVLRYINVADSNLLELPKKFLDISPNCNLREPELLGYESTSSHTAGTIQYAYNLYNQYGAQTKVSPLSILCYLNNGTTGDDVGKAVNKAPKIKIPSNGEDAQYERLKVYSIKYDSKDALPAISVIADIKNPGGEFSIVDTNNILYNITFEEFIFLGGDKYIPQHLAIKDNRLFLLNYSTTKKDVDFDARAYSYNSSNQARIETKNGTATIIDNSTVVYADIPQTHDAINPSNTLNTSKSNYGVYKYPYNDTTKLGGTGPNVSFEIKSTAYFDSSLSNGVLSSSSNIATRNQPYLTTSLKSGEIYRLFIEFLFEDGSWSFPKWVADVKMPAVGEWLSSSVTAFYPFHQAGNYNYLYIETKLLNLPNDSSIVGWRTAIVERKEEDKSIVTQGLINATIKDNVSASVDYLPSYTQRGLAVDSYNYDTTFNFSYKLSKKMNSNASDPKQHSLSHNKNSTSSPDLRPEGEIVADTGDYEIGKEVMTFRSPEIIYQDNLPLDSGYIRRIGLLPLYSTYTYRSYFDVNDLTENTFYKPNNGATVSFPPAFFRYASGAVYSGQGYNWDASLYNVGKLIGHNEDASDATFTDVSYNKQKYTITKSFGGLFPVVVNKAPTSIDNRIILLRATDNIKVVSKNSTTSYTIAGLANIAIKYDVAGSSVTHDYFSYRTGTCAVLTNISNYSNFYGSENTATGIENDRTYGVLAEMFRYLDNQYGGNTYEARQRNRTIPYSQTVALTANSVTTVHMGDTFLQRCNLLSTMKGDPTTTQIAEIISFPVETSINLDLRYDLLKDALRNFDSEEETSYGFNKAYDQQNNTISNIAKPVNFTEITNFPTGVIPSKLKTNGETIDSFTDFLINDAKFLNQAYGKITGVGNFKDNVFAFQPNAIAYLAINPRVQLSTTDAIPIELGAGNIIERYQYVTTNSGTWNKFSIVSTRNGLMYVDLDNKSINFLNAGQGEYKMTDVAGLHHFFKGYITKKYKDLKEADTSYNYALTSVYDSVNNETLFTFKTSNNEDYTIVYNGLTQGFTSFYSDKPMHYIKFNNYIYSTNNYTTINEHYAGAYKPFSITLIVSDLPYNNKIYNNIHFNSNFYNITNSNEPSYVDTNWLQDADLAKVTINKLSAYNDYQRTGDVVIPVENYISSGKRRLRKWNFILPREQNSRNRISSTWLGLTLSFDSADLTVEGGHQNDNIKGIIDDILISYTINNK